MFSNICGFMAVVTPLLCKLRPNCDKRVAFDVKSCTVETGPEEHVCIICRLLALFVICLFVESCSTVLTKTIVSLYHGDQSVPMLLWTHNKSSGQKECNCCSLYSKAGQREMGTTVTIGPRVLSSSSSSSFVFCCLISSGKAAAATNDEGEPRV